MLEHKLVPENKLMPEQDENCEYLPVTLDDKKTPPATNQTAIDNWVSADGHCQTVIFQSVTERYANLLTGCDTSNQMWNTLDTTNSTTSNMSKNHLMLKFQNYKHKEGASLIMTCMELEGMWQDLKSMGLDLPEEAVVTKIITCLPDQYKNWRESWGMRDGDKQTLPCRLEKLKLKDT